MVIPRESAGNLLSFANSLLRYNVLSYCARPLTFVFILTWHGIVNCDAVRIKSTLNFNNTNGTVEMMVLTFVKEGTVGRKQNDEPWKQPIMLFPYYSNTTQEAALWAASIFL
jgi:hypothetical protein